MAPTLALITGCSLWQVWRSTVANRMIRAVYLVLPFVALIGALWTLRAVNHYYYNGWISVDAKDGGFPNAYGALLRITPAEEISGVPVTKETRLRAYAVSPTFAELQPILEGRTGTIWATHGWEKDDDHPHANQEIRGGWFGWALRQAAYETGYYRDAGTTSRFWQRVADEINAACDDGRLDGGRPRSGFFPRWTHSYWAPLGPAIAGATAVVARFSDYKAQSYPSRGDPVMVAKYSRVIHEPAVAEWLAPSFRTDIRIVLFNCYQQAGWPASVLAAFATVMLARQAWRHRSWINQLTIIIALGGGAVALILIVALVDVTSFSALHAMYLSPATPLVLAVWILAPYWALQSKQRNGWGLANRTSAAMSASGLSKP